MIPQDGIRTITFLGAGNIAWHLGTALLHQGFAIREVYSRSPEAASELASVLGCSSTCSVQDVKAGSDLYILCVSDSAMSDVLRNLNPGNSILVHTAGSVPMDILRDASAHYGVFYPLQTFSKQVPVDLRKIPFCLEASDDETLGKITQLAEHLSDVVRQLSSNERLMLHVAAVFASNYTNLMYALAEELLHKAGLPFEYLHPLILESARKAVTQSPADVQTGPARRKDFDVVNKHLRILASSPETREIYRLLADKIAERY